jgi:hypothetical protein
VKSSELCAIVYAAGFVLLALTQSDRHKKPVFNSAEPAKLWEGHDETPERPIDHVLLIAPGHWPLNDIARRPPGQDAKSMLASVLGSTSNSLVLGDYSVAYLSTRLTHSQCKLSKVLLFSEQLDVSAPTSVN